MGKILKIEESKIVIKNKVELQRVIFSDDKIVYVRTKDDEVFPKNTPDKYIDLINTYNASHDELDSTKPKIEPNPFWEKEESFIEDGTADRQSEIKATKNLKKLSKNKDTQAAINRMRDFGTILLTSGIITVIVIGIMLFYAISAYEQATGNGPLAADDGIQVLLTCSVSIILGIVYIALGSKMRKLQYGPTSIKTIAISVLLLGALDLILAGAVGCLEIFTIIYAIIALIKISRYEEWYYGEIE